MKKGVAYKMVLCPRFKNTNSCHYGDDCGFVHGWHEVRKYRSFECSTCYYWHSVDEAKTDDYGYQYCQLGWPDPADEVGVACRMVLCRRQLKSGYCSWGGACGFAHGASELRKFRSFQCTSCSEWCKFEDKIEGDYSERYCQTRWLDHDEPDGDNDGAASTRHFITLPAALVDSGDSQTARVMYVSLESWSEDELWKPRGRLVGKARLSILSKKMHVQIVVKGLGGTASAVNEPTGGNSGKFGADRGAG
eukprot:gnl/MRDRNA2_/MRDRNA2_84634_c0_seq1.p1 gnl/MRDRNA2_/MRDRNA2_84634_c0~~gnl/MRDRNA2_/MRDRNA2_84634_c0_seq1.p1  ORF type:complete len:249 (-),score=22.93 gnl/MRDRNA2_/MRDRNA2_84634_c0_seq1:285-1031(-)